MKTKKRVKEERLPGRKVDNRQNEMRETEGWMGRPGPDEGRKAERSVEV